MLPSAEDGCLHEAEDVWEEHLNTSHSGTSGGASSLHQAACLQTSPQAGAGTCERLHEDRGQRTRRTLRPRPHSKQTRPGSTRGHKHQKQETSGAQEAYTNCQLKKRTKTVKKTKDKIFPVDQPTFRSWTSCPVKLRLTGSRVSSTTISGQTFKYSHFIKYNLIFSSSVV